MSDFKPVTLTLAGYSIEEAHKALLTKACRDFPSATDARLGQMLGVSGTTIAKWCRAWGITRGERVSKKVLAAMQLLRNRGFTIADPRGVADFSKPERRGGGPGRKKTVIAFDTIERGKYLTVPNLELSTVKNYGQRWLKEQSDPTIIFRYAEDMDGVRVFRTA